MLRAILSILFTLTQQVRLLTDIQKQLKELRAEVAANQATTSSQLETIEQQIVGNVTILETQMTRIDAELGQIIAALAPLDNSYVQILFGTPKHN